MYDLYCSQPPGGHQDDLASLVRSSHLVHLYLQVTKLMQTFISSNLVNRGDSSDQGSVFEQ